MSSNPIVSFQARTIGTHRGALLRNCGSTETQTREMSEGHSGGLAQSGSVGSSRGSAWRERRQKGREEKKGLAGKKGRIRPAERCRVSRHTGIMIIETES